MGAGGTNAGEMDAGDVDAGDMGVGGEAAMPRTFDIVFENVSSPWTTSSGDVPLMFAPGVWVIHTEGEPLFSEGTSDRGEGLEALAEDGNPAELASTVMSKSAVVSSGPFSLELGYEATAIGPGESFQFQIEARAGEHFTFAGMFAQSNDLFLAPAPEGIALFDQAGAPISGDVTAQVSLWDAGTEVNEEPGVGNNQAPRQAGPNTGESEVKDVQKVDDEFSYPDSDGFVRVTITPV